MATTVTLTEAHIYNQQYPKNSSGAYSSVTNIINNTTEGVKWVGNTPNALGSFGSADTIIAEANLLYDDALATLYADAGGNLGKATNPWITFYGYAMFGQYAWLEAELWAKTNLYVGPTGPSHGPYGTGTHSILVGSPTLTENGQIEIIGNQTSVAKLGGMSFHNAAATQTDKIVAEIYAYRDTSDNTAALRFDVHDPTTGAKQIGYTLSNASHLWRVDGNETMQLNSVGFVPWASDDLYLGWTSLRWKGIYGIIGDFSGDLTTATLMTSATARVTGLAGTGNRYVVADTDGDLAVLSAEESPVSRPEWDQNGFVDKSDSTIAWADGTRTLTIDGNPTYVYYIGGVAYTQSDPITETIADTEGLWVFYFDSEGSITSVLNPSHSQVDNVIKNYCIIAYVYWDATNNDGRLMDERHGMSMSPATHEWLHDNMGAQYREGMSPADFVISGGDNNVDAQFSISAGEFYDEDIEHELDAVASTVGLEIWYLDGTAWRWTTNAGYSVLSYSGGAGRLAWNDAGTQTETNNGDYILCHVFATNITDDAGANLKYIAIQGQAEYATLSDAREGADTEINDLVYGTLPLEEVVPVATVIFRTQTPQMSNDLHAAVVTTSGGDNFVDWRNSSLKGSGGSVADHGSLSGLSDDDHSQYALLTGRGGETLVIDQVNLVAGTTTLSVDGSNNLTFVDAVTGTKTLAELASGNTYTFSNGITELTGAVTLGGALSSAVEITGGNTYSFSFGSPPSNKLYTFNVLATDAISLNSDAYIHIQSVLLFEPSSVPSTPAEGMIYYDTTANTFYGRDDTAWVDLGNTASGMVYPGAGIALSTGSAWDTSITNNSANWNTAYSHSQIVTGNPHSVGWTELSGVRSGITLSGFNDDLDYNNYTHPNHSGHVTSVADGVQTLHLTAITGQNTATSLSSTDELLINDNGISLAKIDISVLQTYMQSNLTFSAAMVYPGVGIALSTGSAWDTSITDNSANWNTAYSHSQLTSGNPHSVAWAELTGVRSGITLSGFDDDLTYNNYVHPNHSGQVTSTGDGDTVATVSIITAQTELTSGLISDDELMVSDGGVLKRMDVSVIEAYMQANLTFASPAYGTVGQLPYTNGGGDGFSYSSGLVYSSGTLSVTGSDDNVELYNSGRINIKTTGGYGYLNRFVYSSTAGWCSYNDYSRYGGTLSSPTVTPTDAVILWDNYRIDDGNYATNAGHHKVSIDGAISSGNFTTREEWFLKDGTSAIALVVDLYGAVGFSYAGDFSAINSSNDRWLPDKAYVDSVAGSASSPLTTKGDLWGYSTVDARVPVGANGTYLKADSTETLGVSWEAYANTIYEVTLTDNSTTNIVVGDTTNNRAITVRYSMVRGTDYRSGSIDILNSGGTITDDGGSYMGDQSGITLDTDALTGDIRLKCTLTSTGNNATFEYVLIYPDYSTSTTGGTVYTHPNHSGQVTSVADGAQVATVSIITAQTELASGLASTDELILSDDGVLKRMDVSVLQSYMQSSLTFGGSSLWTDNGTTLSPSSVGHDILLRDSSERLIFGDGDTYIYELTDDNLVFVIGGTTGLILNSSGLSIDNNLLPDVTKVNDIGTSSLFWDNVYVDRLYVDSASVYIDVSGTKMTLTDSTGTYLLEDLGGGDVTASGTLTDNTVMVGDGGTAINVPTGNILFGGQGIRDVDDIIPITTKTHDLGSGSLFWDNVYVDRLYVDNISCYIDVSGTELTFRDSANTTPVTLSALIDSLWDDDATNLTPLADRNVNPKTTLTSNLGSGSAYWDNAYIDQIYFGTTGNSIYRNGNEILFADTNGVHSIDEFLDNVTQAETVFTTYTPAAGTRYFNFVGSSAGDTVYVDLDNLELTDNGDVITVSYDLTSALNPVTITVRNAANATLKTDSTTGGNIEGAWTFTYDSQSNRWNSVVLTTH